ncbi:hypothetical protein PIB30_003752 [Stylosanthes scabra]|uniref:Ribonuclease H1 N-terminal domain-containing protein n=1 Tax=Stylosanthes scabra TaxID=79078 RepID=A0ABU6R4V8_9FABA|nr:hypothetical protein [Stylosanthes scabra]
MVECYVVFVGRNPGIYPSWPLAAMEVIEVSRAVHQRYPTMEEGVQAWVQYFSNGGQRVQSTAEVAGDVAPGGGTEGGKVDVGMQSEATVGSIFLKAFGLGGQAGGGAAGKCVKFEGSQPEFGSSSETHVSVSPYLRIGEGFGTQGGGVETSRITGAIEALEGRVSQLEMDKWELLMQLVRLVEQMSAIMSKGKGK